MSRPVGRPPKYDAKFHPDDFIRLCKLGKTKTQICAEWLVNVDTIYDWNKKHKEFSEAVKLGYVICKAYWEGIGIEAMHGNKDLHLGFYVWLTKNMFGWSDKPPEPIENKPQEIEVKVTKYIGNTELKDND